MAQPLDMGIVNSFKSKYSNFLNSFLITSALESKDDYLTCTKKVDMLKVLCWCEKAFDLVTCDTITNCWKKSVIIHFKNDSESGFLDEECNPNFLNNEEPENLSEEKNINYIEDIVSAEIDPSPIIKSDLLIKLVKVRKLLDSIESIHLKKF